MGYCATRQIQCEKASIFADTSIHIQDKNFAFNIAKYAEKSAYRYTDTNPNTKRMPS